MLKQQISLPQEREFESKDIVKEKPLANAHKFDIMSE
jgi:hypothetical protein